MRELTRENVIYLGSFITSLPAYIIPFLCFAWYLKVLRKYHNFNAALNRKQSRLAQLTNFVKLVMGFIIAFQWIFARIAPEAVTYYPSYLIVSDCVHLFSWVRVPWSQESASFGTDNFSQSSSFAPQVSFH